LEAVAEEGAAVGAEEVVLVAAELEVRERVGAVAADELAGIVTQLAGRKRPRRRKRPEDEVGAPEEQQQAGRPDGLVHAAELVAERDRAPPPEKRVARLAGDGPERSPPRRRDPDGEAAQQQASSGDQRGAAERRAKGDRVVPHAERAPAEPEQARGGEARRGLLEIEPLQEVERAEADQQHERQLQRPLPAPPEVGRGHEEEQRGRDGDRMRELESLERLDVKKEMVP